VVAADREWGIGKAGGLPWPRLPTDLAHFRRVTSTCTAGQRNAVVMGRKTWESKEVACKPLPRRLNIVVSRSAISVPEGVVAVASLDDALAKAAASEETFVVGGAQVYELAFAHPSLRWIYLTRIDASFACDTHIEDLDRGFVAMPWEHAAAHDESGVRYRIERLRRRPET